MTARWRISSGRRRKGRQWLRIIARIAVFEGERLRRDRRSFLDLSRKTGFRFEAMLANPPVSPTNQDIEHVSHMIKFLKPGRHPGYLDPLDDPAQRIREFRALMDIMGPRGFRRSMRAPSSLLERWCRHCGFRLQLSSAVGYRPSWGTRATEQLGLTQMALAAEPLPTFRSGFLEIHCRQWSEKRDLNRLVAGPWISSGDREREQVLN